MLLTKPRALKIQNSDGSLMAFICTAMPEAMKKSLFARLIASVGRQECIINVGDEDKPFECIHFSWYNRYTPKVSGLQPSYFDHPWIWTLECWCAPGYPPSHASTHWRDLHKHHTNDALSMLWCGEVQGTIRQHYIWIRGRTCMDMWGGEFTAKYSSQLLIVIPKFESHLPDEYSRLTEAIDMLPGASHSPFSPMSSLVVNLNVSTLVHRDSFDKELCLVMPVGEFDGGALVLVEQGLVLPLRNGDIMVFRSAETMHFNMTYSGCGCSFVMQMDKEFDKWVNNRNGWSGNTLFN